MNYTVRGQITEIEEIASGKSIRILARLQGVHGKGKWRKPNGIALVELPDGSVGRAELHWYEAHGIGRRDMKIKPLVD